ncbi:MAG: isoprenyl transferase [Candidatus Firestonebacteria bacterium]|nr:isoprenyl transferase [Candidatus Firestonebacteria bacterium]
MARKAPVNSPVLDPRRLPRHIAVIMDGNGRWARRRGLPRAAGHQAGMASVRALVRACDELAVPVLTLYAFSTENWKRPPAEVRFLMSLLIEFLRREIDELHRRNVRLGLLGRRDGVPATVLKAIDRGMAQTAANTGLRLNFAFNYGGRREILDAVEAWNRQTRRPPLTEENFAKFLYTAGLPDPDLLIRTSGEMRLSNFLLWQLAYAEIVVTPVLWPDFRKKHLLAALTEYQQRERRFGGVEAVHA